MLSLIYSVFADTMTENSLAPRTSESHEATLSATVTATAAATPVATSESHESAALVAAQPALADMLKAANAAGVETAATFASLESNGV